MEENEVKNEEVVENVTEETANQEVESKVEDTEVEVESDVEVVNEQTITISDEVIAQIANTAASNVKGVDSLKLNSLNGIFNSKSKGVKIQRKEKGIIIDLSIIVEMGYRIPDVSYEIQNIVKTQVENMTGLKVLEVNIFVSGMTMPDKDKSQENDDKNKEKSE